MKTPIEFENKMLSAMIRMETKFRKEYPNIDVLHPDVKCNVSFILDFVKAYDYWKTYMMLPDDHVYKDFYWWRLVELVAAMGEWDKNEDRG